jgi:hypothetical protein
MDRKNTWIVAGAILLGTMLLSVSLGVAQRDFRTEPRSANPGPPHYQVVNVAQGEIIIMDVTTGDLYSAKPQDVKPYNARPRPTPDQDKPRPEFRKDKDNLRPDTRKDL